MRTAGTAFRLHLPQPETSSPITATIHALAASGHPVEIPSSAVLALAPDRTDETRTRFFVADDVVSAEGCYEDWMALFSRSWTGRPV